MNMKKTLAGVLAGAVAVSAMATMAMAADAAYTIDFGAATKSTGYAYGDFVATGAYALNPGADNDLTLDIKAADLSACNGDWDPINVTLEGYDTKGSIVSANYVLKNREWIQYSTGYSVDDIEIDGSNAGTVRLNIPVTTSKYGTGMNLSAFEKINDQIIVTKITVKNIKAALPGDPKALDDAAVKATMVSSEVNVFVAEGTSGGYASADTLATGAVAATSTWDNSSVSATGMATFDISTLALKNSQKRIIKEGATAALTITFDKIENDTTVLKYEINDKADVKLLPKGAESITFQLTNDMLYKAATSEDDVEAFLGKVEILSGVTVKTAKVTVTPANAAADDDTTTPDAGEGTTTPDAGEGTTTPDAGDDANPPMGVAPVALAVLPVALAAAVVAKKRS